MAALHCLLNDYALQGAQFQRDLTERHNVTVARFETARIGGFVNGSIVIEGASYALVQEAARDWLMRDITMVDGGGEVAYNGYVGEISASYGYEKLRRRIDWIATQANIQYYKRHASKKGALVKGTLAVQDTDGIARYGTLVKVINLRKNGLLTTAQANQRAQVFLKRASDFIDIKYSNARKQPARIELTTFGYWTTLARREYKLRYTALTPVSTICRHVIQNTGQEFLSTSTELFDVSGDATIALNTNNQRQAVQEYITAAAKYGDANYDPLVIGVVEDRKLRVANVPQSIDLIFDPLTATLTDTSGGAIKPYLVRAGVRAIDRVYDAGLGEDVYTNGNSFIVERTIFDAITGTFEFSRSDPPEAEYLRRRNTKKED